MIFRKEYKHVRTNHSLNTVGIRKYWFCCLGFSAGCPPFLNIRIDGQQGSEISLLMAFFVTNRQPPQIPSDSVYFEDLRSGHP